MLRFCSTLALEGSIDMVLVLIGRKTQWKLESEKLKEFKLNLVAKVLDLDNNDSIKTADAICSKLNISLELFPILKASKEKSAAQYFCYRSQKKPDAKEYLPLNRVEELMSGLPQYLIFFVEFLYSKSSASLKMQAKGVYLRNKLTQNDF